MKLFLLNKTFIAVLSLIFFNSFSAKSQDSTRILSLKDCVKYANDNNSNIKIAKIGEQIGVRQIREIKGRAFPQVSIIGNFEDRLKVPLLILPAGAGFPAGDGKGIKMGYKYNSLLSGEVTQMLFDPSFDLGLKAAKQGDILNKHNTQQINEQAAYNIGNTYYKAIIASKQLGLLKANLVSTNRVMQITELQFKNGVAKEVDVKRLRVSARSLESQIKQNQLNLEQVLNVLKFQMGMSLDNKIILSDTVLNFTHEELKAPEMQAFENRVDYKILQSNFRLKQLDKSNILRGYYPVLTAYANYAYQGQGPTFGIIKTPSNGWVNFTTSSLGLRLRIPIFDGLQKTFRAQQSKLQLNQIQENMELTKQNINLEISNALTQYQNSIQRLEFELENVKLAEDVYRITQLEFREGVSTSTDVVGAETSLRQVQNNYTQTLFDLYTSKLNLEKSKGNILNYLTTK